MACSQTWVDLMKRNKQPSFNHRLTFGTTRRKSRSGRLLSLLVFSLVAVGVAYALSKGLHYAAPHVDSLTPSAQTSATAAAAAPAAPPVVKVDIEYVVRPNDTLGQIFRQLNLNTGVVPALLAAPAVRDSFRLLKPGDRFTVQLENGALHAIHRRLSETETLSITRSGNSFTAKVVKTPLEVKTVQVRGTVNASLLAAGGAVGLTPKVAQQLAENVFAWDVDFALDIRPGDRFNVIYEQKYRDGEYVGDGQIVAAELTNNGETYRAVRYTSPDGKIDGYFTPDGKSLRRQFVRAPLDLTRVSASPSADRKPLLSMHEREGIDYPAPVGTEVRAAGDGRIRFVGVNGEYGNTVILEHGESTSTLYAHLSTFGRDIQAGQRVKQGEIIGYVGNSGAATAPHLHYEYRVNGVHTDPQTAELPAGPSLPDEYLADFRSKSAALLAGLERPGDAVVTALLVH
jgi:murein DD-endopeptidase MepM/ murein hydrolase activator NlpD